MLADLWSWINQSSPAMTALSTIALVVITAIYAALTRGILKESRELRLSSSRPEVVVSVVLNPYSMLFLDMVIENAGLGPAYDVRFETQSTFPISKDPSLQDIGLFKHGISILAPRQKIEFFLRNTLENFEELMQTRLDIKATWLDHAGLEYTRIFPLRFDHFRELPLIGDNPSVKSADALKRISDTLQKIPDSTGRLKVIGYTSAEIAHENRVHRCYAKIRGLDQTSLDKVTALINSLADDPSDKQKQPDPSPHLTPSANK